MLGPPIPKTGPVFHYEEVKGIAEKEQDNSETYNSFAYDPLMGLIPGVHFDPETGEILDDTILDEWIKANSEAGEE